MGSAIRNDSPLKQRLEDRQTHILPGGQGRRDLVSRVLGCARAVLRARGPGLEAVCYAKALSLELEASRIPHRRDCQVEVRFRGEHLGSRRISLLLDQLAVEILGAPNLLERDRCRMKATLHASRRPIGLLLSFAGEELVAAAVTNHGAP